MRFIPFKCLYFNVNLHFVIDVLITLPSDTRSNKMIEIYPLLQHHYHLSMVKPPMIQDQTK